MSLLDWMQTEPSFHDGNPQVQMRVLEVNLRRKVPDQVFILRFWPEDQGVGRGFCWRAQIRDVNTRERKMANDIDEAFALLQAWLQAAALMDEGGTDERLQ